jgi:hypothetical protein
MESGWHNDILFIATAHMHSCSAGFNLYGCDSDNVPKMNLQHKFTASAPVPHRPDIVIDSVSGDERLCRWKKSNMQTSASSCSLIWHAFASECVRMAEVYAGAVFA